MTREEFKVFVQFAYWVTTFLLGFAIVGCGTGFYYSINYDTFILAKIVSCVFHGAFGLLFAALLFVDIKYGEETVNLMIDIAEVVETKDQ